MKCPSVAFVIVLAALPIIGKAATFTSANRFCWDYNLQASAGLDGFKVFVDGKQAKVAPRYSTCVFINDIAFTPGPHTFEVAAFRGAEMSPKTAPVVAEYVAGVVAPPAIVLPSAPTGFRVL
jgi:hypothetical protein